MRQTIVLTFVALAALLACKVGDKTDASKATPDRGSAAAPEGKPASPTPNQKPASKNGDEQADGDKDDDRPAGAAKAVEDNDNGIPDIPEGRSRPPTVAEWSAAAEVNTQGEGSRPPGCRMKVVREWLKINCAGNEWTHADSMEGFGAEQADYFMVEDAHRMFDYVVRLRKGNVMRIKIYREQGGYAILFMNWPGTAPKPVHIALGKGGDWQ